MAETLRQNPLFRFRCPKCNLRLKTAVANKGRPIVCPQCQHAVLAERAPTEQLPEESIIQRLNESVDQWVRTTCSCGKLVKAPATFAGRSGNCPQCGKTITMPRLGDTFSSAMEVSTLVQAPSEESLLMAVGDLTPDEPSSSSPGITYSRVTPLKQEPQEPQFVRAACYCGAEIHANPDMAGKAVRCPKCNTLLHLPPKPVSRPIFDFDDMARQDLSFGGESITFKPHMVSGGKNLFHEIDSSKEVTAVPVTRDEWETEKRTRALHIRTLRGASALETSARALGLLVSDFFRTASHRAWGTQQAQFVTSAVLVLAAMILFFIQYQVYWQGSDNALPPMGKPHTIRFYDTATGSLFDAPSNTLPPAPAPGGSLENPTGYRVYLFGCDGCASGKETYVGFIETMTPATRKGWQHRMEITGVPSVTALLDPANNHTGGRLISKPSPLQWVEAGSPQGMELINSVKAGKCDNGQTPQWCAQ